VDRTERRFSCTRIVWRIAEHHPHADLILVLEQGEIVGKVRTRTRWTGWLLRALISAQLELEKIECHD